MYAYLPIVMIQGEEGRELADKLYNVEGVVSHGITQDSAAHMFDHLQQWDTGDDVPSTFEPEWGSSDDLTWSDSTFDGIPIIGSYVISSNLGLGYVSLSKVVEADELTRHTAGFNN